MKRKIFALVALFPLFIITFPLSGYPAGPEGFANILWGASKSQIEQEMAQQGFSSKGQKSLDDGSIGIMYYGTLAGISGDLRFVLINGTFCRGDFDFHHEDGGGAEWNAYSKFLSIIQSKYGSPTKTESVNPQGASSVWDGLKAPNSSDTIQIILMYIPETSKCGGSFCSSFFSVTYTNQSFQQRLAGGNKNGL
jgi:hypothetical protein